MKYIALICARGGSKGLPGKNIKLLNGIPLIGWSIKIAKQIDRISRVIVSTESEEIAKIALEYGAEVPFIRPAEISNDFAGTNPVISHAFNCMESQGNVINHICCLYATAPFIESSSISNAYKKFKEANADFCYSVTSFPFPIQRAIKITSKNRLDITISYGININLPAISFDSNLR